LAESVRRYLVLLRKIFNDSLLRFRGRSFLVLVAGFLGVTFQVQAIGLSIYYAKLIEKGDVVTLLGHDFHARSSLPFLSLVAAGVLLSLLISAWLIYYSRTGILSLGRRYEEFCSKRLLLSFGSSLRVCDTTEKGLGSDAGILRLARTDARYSGRIFRLMLSAIVPLITLVAAVVCLFYINAILTIVTICLMGVSAAFQYRVSVAGARSSTRMEKASIGASAEYRKIIQQQKGTSVNSDSKQNWLENIFRKSEVRRFLDAYEGRLRVIEKSRFVSDILLAFAIVSILLMMGASIISEKQGWGRLIVYLIALRYMLVNLKQTVTKITSINRFFPQLKRYFAFLENTQPDSGSEEGLPESYLVSADAGTIAGSLGEKEVNQGSRVGLVSPVSVNRYTIAFLVECLLSGRPRDVHAALSSMWFASSQFECHPGTVRESLGLPGDLSMDDFNQYLERAGMAGRLNDSFPKGLESRLSPELWGTISPDLKISLALLSAVHTDCQWIMVDHKGLGLLPEGSRGFFLSRLSDRIVVVVFDGGIDGVGTYGEDFIAVIGDEGICGLGPPVWIREHEREIQEIVGKGRAKASSRGGMADDLDAEMDDDEI
ncbi:MAG: ABC transporter ATP-binding protein, partial [Nitrospiraceae bacterium]